MGFVYVESEGGAKGGAVPGAVEVFFVFPWRNIIYPKQSFTRRKTADAAGGVLEKKLKPTVVLFLCP